MNIFKKTVSAEDIAVDFVNFAFEGGSNLHILINQMESISISPDLFEQNLFSNDWLLNLRSTPQANFIHFAATFSSSLRPVLNLYKPEIARRIHAEIFRQLELNNSEETAWFGPWVFEMLGQEMASEQYPGNMIARGMLAKFDYSAPQIDAWMAAPLHHLPLITSIIYHPAFSYWKDKSRAFRVI